jgi:lysophospholipase L1-like esterase
MRQEFKEVNAILAKLDDNKQVFFLDIGPRFLDASGVLTPEIMPDAIHPSAVGYQIWADAMQEKLQTLLK